VSGIIGALGEAWSELRHHKLRVLLSLIGIAVSVGALTAVVALCEMQRQIQIEQSDRQGGRAATVNVSASSSGMTPFDLVAFDERVTRVSERFDFSHRTRFVDGLQLEVQTPDQVQPVMTRLVDPAYAVIHRTPMLEGRWFRDGDGELLAPPVIVTESLWESFGRPDLSTGVTMTVQGEAGGTYPVIGVTPRQYMGDEEKTMTMLFD